MQRSEQHPLDRLTQPDAEALERYLNEDIQRFERSNMDGQLERAKTYATGSMPCPRCAGADGPTGYETIRVAACGECRGGWVTEIEAHGEEGAQQEQRLPHVRHAARHRCLVCEGSGVEELEGKSRRPDAFTLRSLCRLCQGMRCIDRLRHVWVPDEEITARARAGSMQWAAPEPDADALTRYGLVTRRLMRLGQAHAATLYAAHGPGLAHRHDPNTGQLWPLVALTPAGKLLVKRYASRCPGFVRERHHIEGRLTHDEWWQSLTQPVLLQWVQRLPHDGSGEARRRGEMFRVAKARTQRMYLDACRAWNRAGIEWRVGDAGEVRARAAATSHRFAEIQRAQVRIEAEAEVKSAGALARIHDLMGQIDELGALRAAG